MNCLAALLAFTKHAIEVIQLLNEIVDVLGAFSLLLSWPSPSRIRIRRDITTSMGRDVTERMRGEEKRGEEKKSKERREGRRMRGKEKRRRREERGREERNREREKRRGEKRREEERTMKGDVGQERKRESTSTIEQIYS